MPRLTSREASALFPALIGSYDAAELLGVPYHDIDWLLRGGHLHEKARVLGLRLFDRAEVEALKTNPPPRRRWRPAAERHQRQSTGRRGRPENAALRSALQTNAVAGVLPRGTVAAIARETGCSRQNVHALSKRLGLRVAQNKGVSRG